MHLGNVEKSAITECHGMLRLATSQSDSAHVAALNPFSCSAKPSAVGCKYRVASVGSNVATVVKKMLSVQACHDHSRRLYDTRACPKLYRVDAPLRAYGTPCILASAQFSLRDTVSAIAEPVILVCVFAICAIILIKSLSCYLKGQRLL